MKVCVLQPRYSFDENDIDECFGGLVQLLGQCDDSMDIMNIHVKIWDADFSDKMIKEIVELIRKYDCEKHVYFMTINDNVIKELKSFAPDICVCVGWDGNKEPLSIVSQYQPKLNPF